MTDERMGRIVVLLLLALARPTPAASDPAPLGTPGPLARRHDVVELPGAGLKLGGTPIPKLGVVAFTRGTGRPIPFQIDEKRGRKIALPDGPERTLDDKPGVFDSEDLIVFMACDAGERVDGAAVEAAFAPLTAWREIRLEDPLSHAEVFVYLVAAEHPPATGRRYVTYEPAIDMVTTAAYRVGLVNALPNYLAMSVDGGPGPNLLDGLRLRADATFIANLAHWKLDESQGQHELIAWKAGPVRVIRRSRHHVVVGLGIRLSAGTANTYFHPEHVYGPGSLKLPFSPSVFFRNITALGGADARDLRGWRYFAPGVTRTGFAIDGRMDEAEQAFASDGRWFVLADEHQALMFVASTSENLAREVPLHLVYRDDAARPAPPERARGTLPLVGYEGRNVERLPGGRYTFSIRVFMLDGYRPGDEARILGPIDAPVTVAMTAQGPVNAPAGDAAAPPAAR